MSETINGRPKTDSAKHTGDLFFIEIPNRELGSYVVHKISTSIHDHQAHIDRMHAAGNHDFMERRVRGAGS